MATCQTDLCRLGPHDTESIEFEVAWQFCVTLAWFVLPWKSLRPIPVLCWDWWAVFQHGRLLWAPPSWILNLAPDWLFGPQNQLHHKFTHVDEILLSDWSSHFNEMLIICTVLWLVREQISVLYYWWGRLIVQHYLYHEGRLWLVHFDPPIVPLFWQVSNYAGEDQRTQQRYTTCPYPDLCRFWPCPWDRRLSDLEPGQVYWSRSSLVHN